MNGIPSPCYRLNSSPCRIRTGYSFAGAALFFNPSRSVGMAVGLHGSCCRMNPSTCRTRTGYSSACAVLLFNPPRSVGMEGDLCGYTIPAAVGTPQRTEHEQGILSPYTYLSI